MEWANPYPELQHSLRTALKDALRRTNGSVTRDQFMECAVTAASDQAERMLLRLFSVNTDGRLEWKPEIVTKEVLLHKLGGSKAIRSSDVITLWSQSRMLRLRTPFPYIAPAGSKSMHVSRYSYSQEPVFGVDVLVRPPAIFSEDRHDGSIRNGLKLGHECFALVIHGTFENGQLIEDDQYFARLVTGQAFGIPKITSDIPSFAWSCEQAMRAPLRDGNARGAVDAALAHLNGFAKAAALAFVN